MTQPPMEPPPPPPPSAPNYGSAPYQPPPPSGSKVGGTIGRLAIRIGIPVAAFVVIGIVSAVLAGNDEADREADGDLKKEQKLSVFEVKKGDCLDDETLAAVGIVGQEVNDVQAIPCDKPHTLEAYHVFNLAGGDDYPGTTEAEKLADAGCFKAFGPFVGVPATKSALTYFYLYPQALAWTEADDRSVTCLVGEASGAATIGTLKGAKR